MLLAMGGDSVVFGMVGGGWCDRLIVVSVVECKLW